MTILISDNGEFSKGLKFEARASAHALSHGPVYGSAGYLALRLAVNNITDTNVYLQSSTDGVNWIDQSHNMTIPFAYIRNIRYVNGKYFIFGDNGDAGSTLYISHSTDMVNWTNWSDNTISFGSIADITYSNNRWLMIVNEGFDSYIKSSTNLTTWTNVHTRSRPGADWFLAYESFVTTGTNTVVVGWGFDQSPGVYVPFFAYSTNGTTWTGGSIGALGGSAALNVQALDVAFSGSIYVMVGTKGMIYTSTNFTTWTARTSGTTTDLYSVSYANGQFVAYGTNTLLTSTDGITWTSRTLPQIQTDDILSYSNGAPVETKPVYANSKWIVSDYTSTNGTTWTILDFQLPNKQPFIKYPYESGWNTWKSIDFWLYIPSRSSTYTQIGIASERGSWTIYVESSSSISRIRYAGAGFTAFPSATLATGTYGQWNHFRLVVDGGSASWYLNGTRSSTTAVNARTAGNDTLNIGFTAYLGENQYSRPVDYYLDEFLLTDEALNSPSATSITVPTAPWRNNEYTSILLHYDTNFEDDPSTPTRNASLDVTATFTEVAVAAKNVKTAVALSSASSQTATATKAVNATASITTTASVAIQANRIKQFSASLDVAASNLTANARSRSFGAILTSAITVNAVVTKTLGVITSSLASTSSLTASSIKVQQFTASLTSSGSTLVANVRSRTSDIALVVTSTLTADAVRTRRLAGTLTTNSSLSVQSNRIKQFSASLDVGAIELVVNQKTTRIVAALTTTSTLAATATRIRRGTATISCQANIIAVGSQSRIMRANLSTTSSLFASTGNVKRAVANLNAGAFQISTGRVVNLANSDTWIVPADNRFWIIQTDNRLWTIAEEDRAYTIKG
jgi:hypothetical protein